LPAATFDLEWEILGEDRKMGNGDRGRPTLYLFWDRMSMSSGVNAGKKQRLK
jgi:hypothetical protein